MSGMRVPPSKMLVLPAAIWAGGFVRPELCDGTVFVAVIKHRAVVTGKDDERIAREPQAIERGKQLAYAPIELDDDIATRPHGGFANEALMRDARDVNVVGGEVEEERFAFILLDEVHSFASKSEEGT